MTNQSPRYQNWAKVGLCVLMVGVSMALVQYKVPTIMLALMGQFSMSAATASWLMSILCLVMALFGTAVMLVGYKAPTIGLVATVAALVIAAAALAWKARER